MKIENWERKDLGDKKIAWQHTSGVRIFLLPVGPGYHQLFLYDKSGAEHFRSDPSYNRSLLIRESTRWQRDYNRYIKKAV